MKSNEQLITCHDKRAHLANVIVSAWPSGIENHLSDGNGVRRQTPLMINNLSTNPSVFGKVEMRAREFLRTHRCESRLSGETPISVAPYASRRLASSAPVDSEPCYATDVGRNVELHYFSRPKLTFERVSLAAWPPGETNNDDITRARKYRRAFRVVFSQHRLKKKTKTTRKFVTES